MLNRVVGRYGKTLDAGCGEGVLVDKYAEYGWDIVGFDKNYCSESVVQGSMTAIPFESEYFDNAMCLDVMEHLQYEEQMPAFSELKRVLKSGGYLILSVPNLAHFTSRMKFVRGKLLRTADEIHHPGDRPMIEYQKMLLESGFKIIDVQGIFPTIPPIYRMVMRYPSKCVGLLRFLRKIPFIPMDWHFQVVFLCQVEA